MTPRKWIAWTLIVMMNLQTAAAAQSVAADPNAAAANRPVVDAAANGTPVVNITTPTARGVSRNQYQGFNIDAKGLILNNSHKMTQTELAGYIAANPYMAHGTASIILNEVTGSRQSHLAGYLEVAGSKAQVVIANPNGLVVDGLGFINTSRAVLTTGIPVISGGDLTGYRVTGGNTVVEGLGMDASRVDSVDILTRAAQVNAGIWANQLNVKLGTNELNAAGDVVSVLNSQPDAGLALDVASIGGMYANKILLVGTEKGMGINSQGQLIAQTNLSLTMDGDIILSGQTQAAEAIGLTGRGLANSGTLYSENAVTVTANTSLNNSGLIAAGSQMKLAAADAVNSGTLVSGIQADGTLGTDGSLLLTVSGNADLSGRILAAGSLSLNAGETASFTQATTYAGKQAVIQAGHAINHTGSQLSSKNLTLTAAQGISNQAGQIQAERLNLTGSRLNNNGGSLIQTGTDDLALNVVSISNQQGYLAANSGNLTVTADTLDNQTGHIQHAGSGSLSISVADRLANASGLIESRGDLAIDSSRLDNQAGQISSSGSMALSTAALASSGQILADGRLTLTTDSLENSGTIYSRDAADITAREMVRHSGTLGSGSDLTISTGRFKSMGVLASGLNTNGSLGESGDLTLTVTDRLQQSSQTLAAGSLSATAGDIDLTGSTTYATGDAAIQTSGSLIHTDGTLAAGQVTMTAGQDIINDRGRLQAGELQVTANELSNQGGLIVQTGSNGLQLTMGGRLFNQSGSIGAAGETLKIQAAELSNQSGRIEHAGQGQATVAVAGAITNERGALITNGQLQLSGQHLENSDGQISGQKPVELTIGQSLINSGRINSGSDLHIRAADLVNSGQMYSAGSGRVTASNQLTNSGDILSGFALELAARRLATNGTIAAGVQVDGSLGQGSLTMEVDERARLNGQTVAGGTMEIIADSISLDNGNLYSGQDLNLSAADRVSSEQGSIAALGSLTLTVGNQLLNRDGQIQAGQINLSTASLDNANGAITHTGTDAMELRVSGDLINRGGSIGANAKKLSISVGSLDNTAGQIAHTGTVLDLTVSRDITNREGSLATAGKLALGGRNLDNSDGLIQAGGNLTASLGSSLVSSGSLQAGEQLNVSAQTVTNSGTIYSGGAASFTVDSLNNSGTLASGADIGIQADTVTTSGILAAGLSADGQLGDQGNLRLTADALTGSGRQAAAGSITLQAADITLSQGITQAGQDMSITGTSVHQKENMLQAGRQLTLNVGDSLINENSQMLAADALVITAGSLANSGTIYSNKDITVTAQGALQHSGTLGAGANVMINADSLESTGVLAAGLKPDGTLGGSGDLTLTVINQLRQSGQTLAAANLSLRADRIDLTNGITYAGTDAFIQADGGLLHTDAIMEVKQALQLTAGQTFDNSRGQIQAGEITVTAGSLGNDGGILNQIGEGDLRVSVSDTLDNRSGAIGGTGTTLTLEAGSIDNRSGRIEHAGSGQTALVSTGAIDNTRGAILTNGALALSSQSLMNSDGQIGGQTGVSLTISQALTNSGQINSGSELIISAADLVNSGQLYSLDSGRVTAGNRLTNSGGILSGSDLEIAAHRLATSGTIGAGVLADGSLGQGNMTITVDDSAGLNGQTVAGGTMEIIADTISLDNGSLYSGRDLNLSAADRVSNDRGSITAAGSLIMTAGSEVFNRDGQIQAGQIKLSASALDNTDGIITHTGSGNMELRVSGDLINQGGSIGANARNLSISAGRLDNTSGELAHAGSSLDLTASQDIINQNGSLATAGMLVIGGRNLDNTAGMIQAGGDLTAGLSGILVNSGSLQADGKLAVNAQTLTNSGTVYSGNAASFTLDKLNNSGILTGGADVTLQTTNLTNSGILAAGLGTDGKFGSGSQGDLNVTAGGAILASGQQAAAGHITLQATDIDLTDSLTSAGQTLTATATGGDIIHQNAVMQAGGALRLTAGGSIDNTDGRIQAASINLAATDLINHAGSLIQTGDQPLAITLSGAFDNTDGYLGAKALTAEIRAGSLDNQGGRIEHRGSLDLSTPGKILNKNGSILTSDSLTIKATALDNARGQIGAGADLALTTGSLDNSRGQLTAAGSINLTTTGTQVLENTDGLILANKNVLLTTGGQLANSVGTIGAIGGDLTLTTAAGLVNTGGTLQAGKQLSITTRQLANDGTALIYGANVTLDTRGHRLDNAGTIASAQSMSITSGDIANSGQIQAGDLAINSHNLTNSGELVSLGQLILTGGSLTNQNATIGAAGPLTITTAGNLDNRQGTILSEAAAQLNANRVDNHQGRIEAGNNLSIQANQAVANQEGLIRSGETLSIITNTLDNSRTQGQDQGLEAVRHTLTANVLDNHRGHMLAEQDADITGASRLDNTQGRISAGHDLTISNSNPAFAVTNTDGSLTAGSDLSVSARSLSFDGSLQAGNHLRVSVNTDIDNSGELLAGGDLTLTTQNDIRNSGLLGAGQTLTVNGRNITNTVDGEMTALTTEINAARTLTNRGLIDGGQTRVSAATLNNLGTGRIYGDQVAIAATALINGEDDGVSATIAARQRLDIGANSIDNQQGALIYSDGDMAIGGRLVGGRADGQAEGLMNTGATIEAMGNLSLAALSIENRNAGLEIETVAGEKKTETRIRLDNAQRTEDDASLFTIQRKTIVYHVDGTSSRNGWVIELASQKFYDKVVSSAPGQITAGGNLSLTGDTLNKDSRIIAGGNVSVSGGQLVNDSTKTRDLTKFEGTSKYAYVKSHTFKSSDRRYQSPVPFSPADEYSEEYDLPTTLFVENAGAAAGRTLAGRDGVSLTLAPAAAGSLQVLAHTAASGAGLGSVANNAQVSGSQGAAVTTGGISRVAVSVNSTNTRPDTLSAGAAADATVTQMASVAPTVAAGSLSAGQQQGVDGSFTQSGIIVGADDTEVNPLAAGSTAEAVVRQGAAIDTTLSDSGLTGEQGTFVYMAPVNTSLPAASLYKIGTNPGSRYLVETDPRFTNQKQWLSSDYMVERMGMDPDHLTKRLGDGYYEQKLIRDQIMAITGSRYLNGYSDDEAAYQALMDNAAAFAAEHGLEIGVTLTPEQLTQATGSMVWLVEQDITLPGGEIVRVLVPQVYLLLADGQVMSGGTLISGNDIAMELTGDLANSGTLKANQNLHVSASNIHNQGGGITADQIGLLAQTDITNIGGHIDAVSGLSLTAGRDITVASTTYSTDRQIGQSSFSRTGIAGLGSLSVSGDNASLNLAAGRDINLAGAQINNLGTNGQTSLKAGNNLNLSTVTVAAQDNSIGDSKNFFKQGYTRETGTQLTGIGNISLTAGNDLTARAAAISSSGGAINLTAGNDIRIEAGAFTENLDISRRYKTGGFLSSKTREKRDTIEVSGVQSSTISGQSVTIQAGNNLAVMGSHVVADQDVSLKAGSQITIASAEQQVTESHYAYTKRSGLLGGGGLGFSIGSQKRTDDTRSQSTTQVGSTIGSLQGGVSLEAGSTILVTASDVLANKDLAISGASVTIASKADTYTNQERHEFKQSGLTVSLGGKTLDTVTDITQPLVRSQQVEDSRLKALYVAKAGRELEKALTQNDLSQPLNKNNWEIGISLGKTKAKSEATSQTSIAQGSQINAGGNVTITAREQDITLTGSSVSGKDISLEAKENLSIEAAANTSASHSTSKNSSSSIGASINLGTGKVGPTLSASRGKGKSDEQITTHTPGSVTASGSLDLKTGQDTTISGSQVSGNTVAADIGGSLRIESKQDTETYAASSKSSGVEIAAGVNGGVTGSASKGKTDSMYASVTEQAGIYAGEGGFDIKVDGNTDLKGAVISSEAEAEKNRLSTDTLTYSDIANKAEYSASSTGTALDTSKIADAKDSGLTPAIGTKASGDADSTTKAAIAEGTIEVRSGNADLANLSRDTANSLNALSQIFDKKTVAEQQELARLFGEIAFEQVHKISKENGWGESSPNKIALHAFVGAVMAELGGGDALSGGLSTAVNEAMQKELLQVFKGNAALHQWASAVLGAAVAELAGGDAQTGGSTAASGTKNNLYKDKDIEIQTELREEGKTQLTLANGEKIIVELDDKTLAEHVMLIVKILEAADDISTALEQLPPTAIPGAMLSITIKGGKTVVTVAKTTTRADDVVDLAKGAERVIGSQGFKTFDELKRVLGPAGEGKQWHHLVEQSQIGKRAGFEAEMVNNVDNVIAIPSGSGSIHSVISGHYSSKPDWAGGKTVRDWLADKSFQEQFDYGLNYLKEFGEVTKNSNGGWIFKPFQ
ncbi:MAG: hemagglutinin repeat-containing protein [Sporomusaceae bacterium]|nr:hemagglutinin repeat-containing protein [Sporomusaceae bacterium]